MCYKEQCLSLPEQKVLMMSIKDYWVCIMQYCHFLLLQPSTFLGQSKTGRQCVWPWDMCRDHPQNNRISYYPPFLATFLIHLFTPWKLYFFHRCCLHFTAGHAVFSFVSPPQGWYMGITSPVCLSVKLSDGCLFFPCGGLCGWLLGKLLYPLRTHLC